MGVHSLNIFFIRIIKHCNPEGGSQEIYTRINNNQVHKKKIYINQPTGANIYNIISNVIAPDDKSKMVFDYISYSIDCILYLLTVYNSAYILYIYVALKISNAHKCKKVYNCNKSYRR